MQKIHVIIKRRGDDLHHIIITIASCLRAVARRRSNNLITIDIAEMINYLYIINHY